MRDVSMLRLHLLRFAYLIVAGGIAVIIWPLLLSPPANWPLMNSVVSAMMGGISVLAALGLRYPLQMLPVLLLELVWKTIWLSLVALPSWLAGHLSTAMSETIFECVLGVVLIPLIPWGYVTAHYIRSRPDRWWGASSPDGDPVAAATN